MDNSQAFNLNAAATRSIIEASKKFNNAACANNFVESATIVMLENPSEFDFDDALLASDEDEDVLMTDNEITPGAQGSHHQTAPVASSETVTASHRGKKRGHPGDDGPEEHDTSSKTRRIDDEDADQDQ